MILIRSFKTVDYTLVKSIYQQGIDSGNATFQLQAKEWNDWDSSYLATCRFVVELDGKVVAWAALSAVSDRSVYRGVAEVSIYVSREACGQGIGQSLLKKLTSASEQEGLWTLQAGIFPENKSSIAIHIKNGFKQLGVRERLGQMKGVWRDVLVMERRSKVSGL